MPKISEIQRERRRQRFLDAAWRCFSRNGVATTSMDDITREAASSAGSLYLYFSTKDELIRAVITSSVNDFEAVVGAIADSPAAVSRTDFIRALLSQTETFGIRADGVNLFALALQGWAHAQTDPETARIVRTTYRRILRRFASTAETWGQGAQDADALASLIGSIVLGFVTQRALGMPVTAASHSSALELLEG